MPQRRILLITLIAGCGAPQQRCEPQKTVQRPSPPAITIDLEEVPKKKAPVWITMPEVKPTQGELPSMKKVAADHEAKKDWPAAQGFHEILHHPDASEKARLGASYHLALSLYRAEVPVVATHYLGEVARTGPSHNYFPHSVKRLLWLRMSLADDVVIPSLINKIYSREFARFDTRELSITNYTIGSFEGGHGNYGEAKQFLRGVPKKENLLYARARYALAEVCFATIEKNKCSDVSAKKELKKAAAALEKAKDKPARLEERIKLMQMKLSLRLRQYDEAIRIHSTLKAGSDAWHTAAPLAIRALARLKRTEETSALLQKSGSGCLLARAELERSQCQFDVAAKTTDRLVTRARALIDQLRSWSEKDAAEILLAIGPQSKQNIPKTLRDAVLRDPVFRDRLAIIEQADREREVVKTKATGALQQELLEVLERIRSQRLRLAAERAKDLIAFEINRLEERLVAADALQKKIAQKNCEKETSAQEQPIAPLASFEATPQNVKGRLKLVGEALHGLERDEVAEYKIAHAQKKTVPAWLKRGSWKEEWEGRKYSFAVGEVSGMSSSELRVVTAENRARGELSRMKSVKIRETKTKDSRRIQTTSSAVLHNAFVVDWYESEGTFHALIVQIE